LKAQTHFGGQTPTGEAGITVLPGGQILAETQDVHYCLPAGLTALSRYGGGVVASLIAIPPSVVPVSSSLPPPYRRSLPHGLSLGCSEQKFHA